MPQITLTDLAIRKLKPSDKQQEFFCDNTHNFGLRVSQSGTKSFFVMLTNPRRRVHLGKYPQTKLQDARKQAKQLALFPQAQASATQFSDAVESYLTLHVEPNYRTRSAYLTTRHLRQHCQPVANLTLGDLTAAHLTRIFDALAPSEANHLFGALRTFFNWCERRDLIQASPLRKLQKPHREHSRERTLSDAELRTIWRAAPDTDYGKVIKLLILTGQRRGEIAALRREWIATDRIIFPKDITKNGTEHMIPLTTSQRQLIGERPAGYVFPARTGPGPINGWGKHKGAFDKICAVTDWTLHDLRRTFATIHARIGTPPYVTEALLNHRTGVRTPIQRIYDRHDYFSQMQAAMRLYEKELQRIVSPGLSATRREAGATAS